MKNMIDEKLLLMYMGYRKKHLKLERMKLPTMKLKGNTQLVIYRQLNGRIKELMLTIEVVKKGSLENVADYEKSKVKHLQKMAKFTKQYYDR